MGLFNLFKAQFKTPAFDTVDALFDVYFAALNRTNDSKSAFLALANEVVNQMRKAGRSTFTTAEDTYRRWGPEWFNELSTDHSKNVEKLRAFVYGSMSYIRRDLYGSDAGVEVYQLTERLKVKISSKLD